jgi:hypothetical protein
VLDAQITTIHPQLRDLIVCPQIAGKIYHVKAQGVVEMTMEGVMTGGRGADGGSRNGPDRAKVGLWPPITRLDPLPRLTS